MMNQKKNGKAHAFSVEMRSNKHVKCVTISKNTKKTLFEGNLGELKFLGLVEGAMLEIMGTNGVIRIDMTESELTKIFTKKEMK